MDNFIVSARKYRPATFVSVIGQSHITSTLKNAITRNQLAHAYLFCGPRGVGKTTCARIFAKAINCLAPREGEACNQCESCRAFNEGRSFNIHELDAASNNSVDDIRNLTDQVRIPPQIGRYSVYIIDEVHMLSLQAFNAFLKTLEEPPAHAVFILATTEKHKIIPTILSRCQIYDFNRIRVEDTVGYLKYRAEKENVVYDDESLHIIARKADGGMRDALSMFDKVVSFCGSELRVREVADTLNVLDYDTYFKITERILAGDYVEALLTFDEVLRKGFSGPTFIAGLNNHFRDLMMCKNQQTLPLLEVTGSVAERYKQQAAQCPVPLLFEGIDLLTATDAGFRTASNQRLHVELSLMKLCGLGQKKNEDTLIPALPQLHGHQTNGPLRQAPANGTVQPLQPPVVRSETPGPQSAGAISSSDSAAAAGGQLSPEPGKPATTAPIPSPAAMVPVTEAPLRSAVSATGTPSSPVFSAPAKPMATSSQLSETPRQGAEIPEGGISLSGRSILSLLNSAPGPKEETSDSGPEETETDPDETEGIDEQTQQRLERACALFTKELLETRPRIGAIFRDVTVEDNRVSIKVPNLSLQDEIDRCMTDMQRRLQELGGLHVPIRFTITVEADPTGLKPVKVEDRLRYLTEKNPLVAQLRKRFDLDIE